MLTSAQSILIPVNEEPEESSKMDEIMERYSVAVCIATYNRPLGLRRLLDSLRTQAFGHNEIPEWKIVVVENDETAPNAEYINTLNDGFPIPIVYAVQPKRGIASVRNLAVELAKGSDYVAFIDDDEVASNNWLDELLHVMQTNKADVVCGPVLPQFETPPEPWIITGRFFERDRHPTGTEIDYGRTGNVLISSRWFSPTEKPFNESLNLTGGEDTLFFWQIHGKGAKFVWADDAIVDEFVPPQRANKEWLIRRAKRLGNTISLVENLEKRSKFSRIKRVVKCAGHFVLGFVSLIPATIISGRGGLVKSLCMINRAYGEWLGLTGRSYEIYK